MVACSCPSSRSYMHSDSSRKSILSNLFQENKISVTGIAHPIQDTLSKGSQQRDIECDSLKMASSIPPQFKKEGFRHNIKGWLVVTATFIVNFFCLGIIFQWGNYQQLYLKVYAEETDAFRISFIGSIAPTTLLSTGVFLPPVIRRIGYRWTMAIGAILAPLGLFLARVLFGLGCGFVYSPAMALPSQWFKKNRALATGLASSGSGIGSLVISPLTEKLFETVGHQNALRVLGGAMAVGLLLATALAFSTVAPATSVSSNHHPQQEKLGYRELLSDIDFIFLVAFSALCYFGYFGPMFYVPQYTTYLGHSAVEGAALIAVMSGMNSVSRIFMGFMADRCGNINVMLFCALAAGLFTSVLWQFANNYNTYMVYCVLNGLTGGAFVPAVPVVVADIVGLENIQQGMGICFIATFFGNLLGPAIAGKLLQQHGWTAAIQFPGAITLFSAVILFSLRMKRSKGKIIMKL
ncbi:major facilitator superfamily domain-containing protein [Absidia repens]|uniref:Major facilitator superfamily domain-containing protein n=1 Tax=Absidia repens TaxID=90262 RepID=A0A1X2IGC8_9FUNG|nr:major facilitator superfamily domain-containing protein [Absidia repens]